MKVLPKNNTPYDLFNEEDLEGMRSGFILTESEIFYDDLIDEQILVENYVENLKKIPYEKWTASQRNAYYQYLLDSKS